MSGDAHTFMVSAAGLARHFDDSFALPQRQVHDLLIPVLVVRAGDKPHAIALADLLNFSACTPIVPLPRQRPACLGLVAYRGAPIPMYSLDLLLGFTDPGPAPRWMAVTQARIAVGIHDLIGHVQVTPDDLRRRSDQATRMVMLATEPCPLVDLASLISPVLAPAHPGRTTSQE